MKHRANPSHIMGFSQWHKLQCFLKYLILIFPFFFPLQLVSYSFWSQEEQLVKQTRQSRVSSYQGCLSQFNPKIHFMIPLEGGGRGENQNQKNPTGNTVRFQMLRCPSKINFFQDSMGNDHCQHVHISDSLNWYNGVVVFITHLGLNLSLFNMCIRAWYTCEF